MKKVACIASVLALSACAGKYDYTPPRAYSQTQNTVTVDSSKDDVWKKLIVSLGKNFFVINNMDKESGFINISYNGDPELFVDCGVISSYVKNARGERTYTFPGSRARMDYEIMSDKLDLYQVRREMALEGRVNVIVQPVTDKTTSVSVNTKYVLTRTTTARDVEGRVNVAKADANFNTGQTGTMPGYPQSLSCSSTGKFERDIIDFVKK